MTTLPQRGSPRKVRVFVHDARQRDLFSSLNRIKRPIGTIREEWVLLFSVIKAKIFRNAENN
jgi:hypothetical protein